MSEYYLVHHGIKGQKWGIRRFQNEDGSLTSAGAKRYSNKELRKIRREQSAYEEKAYQNSAERKKAEKMSKRALEMQSRYQFNAGNDYDEYSWRRDADRIAGQQFNKMWSDYREMDKHAKAKASESAQKYIAKKYGDTAVKQLKQQDKRRTAAFMAVAIGVPVAMFTASAIASKKQGGSSDMAYTVERIRRSAGGMW